VNTDKAVRYHRLQRRASVGGTVLSTVMLVALLVTGGSTSLRNLAATLTSGAYDPPSTPAVIAVYVLLVCVVWEVVTLPLGYYSGVVLERRYGLTLQTTRDWLRDQLKGILVLAALAVVAAEFLYYTIRRWPDHWWLVASVGFGCAVLVLARLAPIVLLPLFYQFKPLDRPQLRERLRTLAARAGLPALGAYEWGLGEKTRRANAALVGVGRTRRILLSDTLIADYSDDEIEVVLAHELAHHAHHDVLRAVAAQTALLLLGLAAAAWATRVGASAGRWMPAFDIADVAGLPLIVMAAGTVCVIAVPIMNALSRRHERRADAYALRLTARPTAFISAMRRLAAQNLAEPQPSRPVQWLFHSHPPIQERIEHAQRFDRLTVPRSGGEGDQAANSRSGLQED
jgi:STE24 endopeptidase